MSDADSDIHGANFLISWTIHSDVVLHFFLYHVEIVIDGHDSLR